MTIGMLLLRVVVGLLFVGHGTQKVFGWWGGGGPEGTARMFDELGFRPGRRMGILAGITETSGGALVALGLLTPLGAAAIVGVMVCVGAILLPDGLWNTTRGIELPLVYAESATALAFAGPGRWSLDRALGLDLRGGVWGLVALALGVGTGLALVAWRQAQLQRDTASYDPRHQQHRPAA